MLMEWHNGLLKVLYYVLGLMYESRADKIQLNRPSFSLLDGNPAAWPILREMERQKPFRQTNVQAHPINPPELPA